MPARIQSIENSLNDRQIWNGNLRDPGWFERLKGETLRSRLNGESEPTGG
jgi:hypothetical protein